MSQIFGPVLTVLMCSPVPHVSDIWSSSHVFPCSPCLRYLVQFSSVPLFPMSQIFGPVLMCSPVPHVSDIWSSSDCSHVFPMSQIFGPVLMCSPVPHVSDIWSSSQVSPCSPCLRYLVQFSCVPLFPMSQIFGPVLTVLTFRTPKEAIALANNTRYGLGESPANT